MFAIGGNSVLSVPLKANLLKYNKYLLQSSDRSSTIHERRPTMAGSVYKIIELVGTSKKSWEDAAKNAVETASKSLKDLRIAEIVKLDMQIDKGKVAAYRARVNVSFKYVTGSKK